MLTEVDLFTRHLPPHLDSDCLYFLRERLKARPKDPGSERVSKILQLLYAIGRGGTDDVSAFAALGKSLRAYKWVSHVKPHGKTAREVLLPDPSNSDAVERWEYREVRMLLDILNWPGAVSRIRKCEMCGEWFFAANRLDQRFCDSKCKQKNYDTDPVKKAQRREVQRRNAATERERTKDAKKRVGFSQTNK